MVRPDPRAAERRGEEEEEEEAKQAEMVPATAK